MLGPISRFTFGESSSGTSIDAQTTGCSPESPRENIKRRNSHSPLASRKSLSPKLLHREKDDKSSSKSKQGKSSPLSQRAFKQLRWCSTSKKSSGSFISRRKLSREDSMMATLMTSLDQVPELGGHLDMDSTSCSLCSSGDDDPPSLPRGQSPSLFPRVRHSSNTPSDSEAVPPKPASPVFPVQNKEDDDDTLGSNSDYTIEGELDDQDEFLPSPSEPSSRHHPDLQLNDANTENTSPCELPTPCDNPSNSEVLFSLATSTNDQCQSDSSVPHRTVKQNSESSWISTSSTVTPSLRQEVESAGTSLGLRVSLQESETETECQALPLPEHQENESLVSNLRSSVDVASASNSEFRSFSLLPQASEVLESQLLSVKCQSLEEEATVGEPTESRASLTGEEEGSLEKNKTSLPDS